MKPSSSVPLFSESSPSSWRVWSSASSRGSPVSSFIEPHRDSDPDAVRIAVTATPNGVAVRATDGGGSHLLTADQADELTELISGWTWAGVLCGGGAVLSAHAFESCVVVRCGGFASAEELHGFVLELVAAARAARAWVPPETMWSKRKRKKAQQLQGVEG